MARGERWSHYRSAYDIKKLIYGFLIKRGTLFDSVIFYCDIYEHSIYIFIDKIFSFIPLLLFFSYFYFFTNFYRLSGSEHHAVVNFTICIKINSLFMIYQLPVAERFLFKNMYKHWTFEWNFFKLEFWSFFKTFFISFKVVSDIFIFLIKFLTFLLINLISEKLSWGLSGIFVVK